MNKFERLQCNALKKCLGFTSTTKHQTVRLICGAEPIQARLDFLKMAHFLRILGHQEGRITSKILRDSLVRTRSGFAREAIEIAKKYELIPTPVEGFSLTSSALPSVSDIKKKIYKHHFDQDMLALNSSTQAKLFYSLFPKDTSYFKYKPLDIATSIISSRKNRAARSTFLQLLAGSRTSRVAFATNRVQPQSICFSSARNFGTGSKK